MITRWPVPWVLLFYDQEKVGVTGDLKASDFASITREDGKKQTTYKGCCSTTSRATPRRATLRATARRRSSRSRSRERHRGTAEARWLISGPARGPSRLPISTRVRCPDGPERVRGHPGCAAAPP